MIYIQKLSWCRSSFQWYLPICAVFLRWLKKRADSVVPGIYTGLHLVATKWCTQCGGRGGVWYAVVLSGQRKDIIRKSGWKNNQEIVQNQDSGAWIRKEEKLPSIGTLWAREGGLACRGVLATDTDNKVWGWVIFMVPIMFTCPWVELTGSSQAKEKMKKSLMQSDCSFLLGVSSLPIVASR